MCRRALFAPSPAANHERAEDQLDAAAKDFVNSSEVLAVPAVGKLLLSALRRAGHRA